MSRCDVPMANGMRMPIASLGEGDFLGEMVLLAGEKSSVTASVVETATVLSIEAPAINALVHKIPRFALEGRQKRNHVSGNAVVIDASFRLQARQPTSNSITASKSSPLRRQVEKLFRESRVVLCEQFIEPTPEKPQTLMEEQVHEGITR